MIEFTQLPSKLPYPVKYKSVLSCWHSSVISYAIENSKPGYTFKDRIIRAINTISYIIMRGDSIPFGCTQESPMTNLPYFDDSEMESYLGNLFVKLRNIKWDVEFEARSDQFSSAVMKSAPNSVKSNTATLNASPVSNNTSASSKLSDISLKSIDVPTFDSSSVFYMTQDALEEYKIYTSIPTIPKRQCDVSVTTDIDMCRSQNMNYLYPNTVLRCRNKVLYENVYGLDYDDDLGIILPVEGFTIEQIKDNIIKYPHFYKLRKYVDGEISNFYTTIEIDGTLHNTLKIWKDLPESKVIPYQACYIKEYVIRRYLLERDVNGISHKYPLVGTLDPFISLFLPDVNYINRGYTDIQGMALQCVQARINFKTSRNPILRRHKDD